jgi:hypothetical protein
MEFTKVLLILILRDAKECFNSLKYANYSLKECNKVGKKGCLDTLAQWVHSDEFKFDSLRD